MCKRLLDKTRFFNVKRRFFLEKNAYLEYDRRVNKITQRRVRNVNYY